MDGFVFALFAFAALVGGFVSGFSGFAMGLVVSGIWLHIITPMHMGRPLCASSKTGFT